MSYIDKAFYDSFSDISIPENEFSKLAERASDIIDSITMHRIQKTGGISALPEWIQARIKKATVSQIETMFLSGGIESIAGGNEVQSASIGKFSYSVGDKTENCSSIPIAPMANAYLAPTGLLYRGLC